MFEFESPSYKLASISLILLINVFSKCLRIEKIQKFQETGNSDKAFDLLLEEKCQSRFLNECEIKMPIPEIYPLAN